MEIAGRKQIICLIIVWSALNTVGAVKETKNFDPNDCYEPGTVFLENERNLGFCPCKYGYHGPTCYEIHDCVIGELRTENCTRDIQNDYDLQWRCAEERSEIVKICTCPDGFRGETCEFIMENNLSTYYKTIAQSQKFFEVIYNKTDSVLKIAGTKACKIVIEYRRLIMFILFLTILELAWRYTKKQQKQYKEKCNCQSFGGDQKFNLDISKSSNLYYPLPKYDFSSLEEADRLPEKKKIEEDSVCRFTKISEISEELNVIITPKVSRPHLHI